MPKEIYYAEVSFNWFESAENVAHPHDRVLSWRYIELVRPSDEARSIEL
jgi:hypothetical protein